MTKNLDSSALPVIRRLLSDAVIQPHQAVFEAEILTEQQIADLRLALQGRSLALCYGAGVDTVAMLVALRAAGIHPNVITHADTNAEKRATKEHMARMNVLLASWGWPQIDICRKVTKETTPYQDLEGNCLHNETLPSLAFGMKSCSIKYKQGPQDQFIKGAKRGPNARPPHPLWIHYQETGVRIAKLIGYDSGQADTRRSKNLQSSDADFDYIYPLQVLKWTRADCVAAITRALGADMVPVKSACFMCPASKVWELYWLAAHEPDLLERALVLERKALTGRHSRFDEVEFGASWDELVRNADRFPSTSTTVGLGRSFACGTNGPASIRSSTINSRYFAPRKIVSGSCSCPICFGGRDKTMLWTVGPKASTK